MSKSSAKKIQAAYRQLRGAARRALALVGCASLGIAAVTLGAGALVGGLASDAAAAASVATLVLVGIMTLAEVVLEVRAWKATVAACENEPSGADRAILAAALWFGGGLPLAVVAAVRATAEAAPAQTAWATVAVSVVLIFLAAMCFLPELRKR